METKFCPFMGTDTDCRGERCMMHTKNGSCALRDNASGLASISSDLDVINSTLEDIGVALLSVATALRNLG